MRKLLLSLFIFIISIISFAQSKCKVIDINVMGLIFQSSINKAIEDEINNFLSSDVYIKVEDIEIKKLSEYTYIVIIAYQKIMEDIMTQINPKELMEQIKSMKHKVTNEDISRFYDVCLEKLDKYIITGQIDACNKIKFLIDNVSREYRLIENGIDTFVYFNDIRDYIDKVKDKQISIIELSRYEREIPDEIIDIIAMCREKNLFDEYIVLFTDYQKEMSKKTAKEDREKDPILFGMMYDENTNTACPRFYYLGDWEDNYCDLTLEKMLAKIGEDKEHKVEKPLKSIDELNEKLNRLNNKGNDTFTKTSVVQLSQKQLNVSNELYTEVNQPKNIFKKIKTIFKRGE